MEFSWSDDSVKKMLNYVSNADGEGHDAAVYVSGFEFDRTDPRSVEQVVRAILRKYRIYAIEGPMTNRSLLVPLSDIDSYLTKPDANAEIVKAANSRAAREKAKAFTYIPKATEFSELLQRVEEASYVAQITDSKGHFKRDFDLMRALAETFSDPFEVVMVIIIFCAWVPVFYKP